MRMFVYMHIHVNHNFDFNIALIKTSPKDQLDCEPLRKPRRKGQKDRESCGNRWRSNDDDATTRRVKESEKADAIMPERLDGSERETRMIRNRGV